MWHFWGGEPTAPPYPECYKVVSIFIIMRANMFACRYYKFCSQGQAQGLHRCWAGLLFRISLSGSRICAATIQAAVTGCSSSEGQLPLLDWYPHLYDHHVEHA